MKRIIILTLSFLLLGSVMNESQAQGVVFAKTASNPNGAITDTGIDTSTYRFTRGYSKILFGMTYTRATGTAAGTAILEYKISSSDNYKSAVGDTLTLTNAASQTVYWNKEIPARYWRVRVGGGTTVTATVAVKAQTD